MLLKQNSQLIEQNVELTKNGITNTSNSHNTNKIIRFKPSELKLCKKQSWTIVGQGLSKINNKDIYDVSERGNIILCIDIV